MLLPEDGGRDCELRHAGGPENLQAARPELQRDPLQTGAVQVLKTDTLALCMT